MTVPNKVKRLATGRTGSTTAVFSVLTLAVAFGFGTASRPEVASVTLLMVLVLLTLLAGAFRWAPQRHLNIGAPLAGFTIALWPVPFMSDSSLLEHVGAAAFWAVPALGAALIGGYPRWMEHRRLFAVAQARETQRLELSRDLHDFVAHDISGIVVQAQAARFVAHNDPGAAVVALERIERAGLAALSAIDRAVHMLGASDPAAPERLEDLVTRFTRADGTAARANIAPDAEQALSRETAATVYRVVVEALTNVRRHAPEAVQVTVTLGTVNRPEGAAVQLSIINDVQTAGVSRFGGREQGGSGLLALAERVFAFGGSFEAGEREGCWQVLAVFPVTLIGAT
ncbi:MAG: two-component sensor histidine kinase [Corynebacteriales bacterium]|nr:two-component sensor histidine kinase [Mycobacteriales bacterium]